LLILRKHFTNGIWYIACVCQLAVARLKFHCNVRNIPNAVCVVPPEDEQLMLETCKNNFKKEALDSQ
jgi:hypothetical protein